MNRFRSLQTKIFVFFLTVTAVALVASLLVVNNYDTRQTVQRIRKDLTLADEVFKRILAQRREQLATNARLLASDYAFRAAVGTREPGTVLSAAMNHRQRLGADRLVVTDDAGLLL